MLTLFIILAACLFLFVLVLSVALFGYGEAEQAWKRACRESGMEKKKLWTTQD
jgi:hypothetical protein